jgi:hypothetical protein
MKNYHRNALKLILLALLCKMFLGDLIRLISWNLYRDIYRDAYFEYIIPVLLISWGIYLLVIKNEEDSWSWKKFNEKIKNLKSLFYNNTKSLNVSNMENFNPKKIVSAGRKFLLGMCIAILTYLICFGTLYFTRWDRDDAEMVLGFGIVGGIITFYLNISAALDLMNCEK